MVTECLGSVMPWYRRTHKLYHMPRFPYKIQNVNYNINVVKRFVSHHLERVPGWDTCLYAIPITYGHT